MSELTEKELAGLLRVLTPAPAHWVEAAKQIPRIKKQLVEVLPFLESTAPGRAAETADLEKAIEAAGLTPEPQLIAELQRHLTQA
jgi:hypothetical protein